MCGHRWSGAAAGATPALLAAAVAGPSAALSTLPEAASYPGSQPPARASTDRPLTHRPAPAPRSLTPFAGALADDAATAAGGRAHARQLAASLQAATMWPDAHATARSARAAAAPVDASGAPAPTSTVAFSVRVLASDEAAERARIERLIEVLTAERFESATGLPMDAARLALLPQPSRAGPVARASATGPHLSLIHI